MSHRIVEGPAPAPEREEGRGEATLVTRMLAGDEDAMETFADDYFPGLYRFALVRLDGDAELTREIVQTTVLKALAKLASYRGEASLTTWLCACCRNEIAMHFRRRRRGPTLVEIQESTAAEGSPPRTGPGEAPEHRLARREEARRVHATLDLLLPRYARVLEWKYVEHLSVNEIAARLETGAKAAESLLGRARRAFRECYERLTREGESGSGPASSRKGLDRG